MSNEEKKSKKKCLDFGSEAQIRLPCGVFVSRSYPRLSEERGRDTRLRLFYSTF